MASSSAQIQTLALRSTLLLFPWQNRLACASSTKGPSPNSIFVWQMVAWSIPLVELPRNGASKTVVPSCTISISTYLRIAALTWSSATRFCAPPRHCPLTPIAWAGSLDPGAPFLFDALILSALPASSWMANWAAKRSLLSPIRELRGEIWYLTNTQNVAGGWSMVSLGREICYNFPTVAIREPRVRCGKYGDTTVSIPQGFSHIATVMLAPFLPHRLLFIRLIPP